jgi:hypothetical protein
MAAVQLRKVDAPEGRHGADVPVMERGAIKEPTQFVH